MTGAGSRERIARRAVLAACLGFFVDMFEVYLPVAVLAPALSYFLPPHLSGTAQATLFYAVFSVSLIGRPIGAVIFGHFGDRLGRRRTTLVSVAGFGIATLLIAALPGYARWGAAAAPAGWDLRRGRIHGSEPDGHGIRARAQTRALRLVHSHRLPDSAGVHIAARRVHAPRRTCRRGELRLRRVGLAHSFPDRRAPRRHAVRLLLSVGSRVRP